MKEAYRKYRGWIITGILGGLLAFLAVYGWQSSMKYDTFLLQAQIWRKIGHLSHAGCLLAFAVLFPFFTWLLHFSYTRLERRRGKENRSLHGKAGSSGFWQEESCTAAICSY